MSNNIQSVRGMNDILPGEAEFWEIFEETVRSWLKSYGYRPIRLPIVEPTPLFKRAIGEVTDIVEKEMYSFIDSLVAMRPYYIARTIGGLLFLLGAVVASYNVWMTIRMSRSQAAAEAGDSDLPALQGATLQALNIQHVFLRPESARSVPLMRLDTRRLAVTARALETHLGARQSLLDSGFSAADCMLGFNIDALFRFLPAGEYPALAAYRDRMIARPAYLRARAAGGDSMYSQGFYEVPDDAR